MNSMNTERPRPVPGFGTGTTMRTSQTG
jgi:hypothetical protein